MKGFVKAEAVVEVIRLGYRTGKNVLLWGPAGHGKSELTLAVMRELGLNPFVQSFGEGMDEGRLYGGIDLRALNEDNALVYNTERSFIAAEAAIFEEIFDAPASVLLSLKDTLTARQLRNGAQQVPMRCRFIVALTNKDPAEISELGPSAHALIERFPLQLRVAWDSYGSADYRALFEARGFGEYDAAHVLAEALGEVAEKGEAVSPRTAMHAIETLLAAADFLEPAAEHYALLRFVAGLEVVAEVLTERFAEYQERLVAEAKLAELERQLEVLERELAATERPVQALRVAKAAEALESAAQNQRVSDALTERRKGVLGACGKLKASALSKALSLTTGEVQRA